MKNLGVREEGGGREREGERSALDKLSVGNTIKPPFSVQNPDIFRYCLLLVLVFSIVCVPFLSVAYF